MERREFLAVSVPVIAGASVTLARSEPSSGPGPLLSSPPVVQHPTEEGFTVAWQVRGPATGWVTWGTRADRLDRVAHPGGPGLLDVADLFLTARVDGVPAGAREIYYQVHARPIAYQNAYSIDRGPVESGPVRRLRLPSGEQPTIKLAVVNDTHENEETLAALAGRIDHHQPDALLWNGDTCNDFYDDARLGAIVLGPGAAPGHPEQGGWASTRPLLFVPGNHDVRGPRARRLPEALAPWPVDVDPRATAAAGGAPWCFVRRLGPLALVGLDTGEDKPDERPVFAGLAGFEPWREAQRDWLNEALRREAVASAPHLLACCHIPLRGLPGHDDGQGTEGYARRFANLPLERDQVALLPLNWTLVHPIDENSPIYNMGRKELVALKAEFIILIAGYDDTYAQQVQTNSSYTAEEIVCNALFEGMYFSEDGHNVLELDRINAHQKLPPPGAAASKKVKKKEG